MKKIFFIFMLFASPSMAQSPCNVGDILFYDGSCGKELVEGKHPIAIVFAPVRRVAVSLNQVIREWGSLQTSLEIASPKGLIRNKNDALNEFSGQELAAPFIEIAPNFYPAIRECASMDWVNGQAWYVPELGLVNQIYQLQKSINKTLADIKGADLITSATYWSGSQYSYSQSWQQNFFNGVISYNNNNKKNVVRCVISY